jgi:hypothetical protein
MHGQNKHQNLFSLSDPQFEAVVNYRRIIGCQLYSSKCFRFYTALLSAFRHLMSDL